MSLQRMSNESFEAALRFVLRWESGYVHHPADPGGATNRGITQAVYDAWRKGAGETPRPVSMISDDEVRRIYYSIYWLPVERYTQPEWKLFRLTLFDTFVNFGVSGGTSVWQQVIKTEPDGIWGPKTAQGTLACLQQRGDLWAGIALVGERVRYRARRVVTNKKQLVFLQGWLNRDIDLALQLLEYHA